MHFNTVHAFNKFSCVYVKSRSDCFFYINHLFCGHLTRALYYGATAVLNIWPDCGATAVLNIWPDRGATAVLHIYGLTAEQLQALIRGFITEQLQSLIRGFITEQLHLFIAWTSNICSSLLT